MLKIPAYGISLGAHALLLFLFWFSVKQKTQSPSPALSLVWVEGPASPTARVPMEKASPKKGRSRAAAKPEEFSWAKYAPSPTFQNTKPSVDGKTKSESPAADGKPGDGGLPTGLEKEVFEQIDRFLTPPTELIRAKDHGYVKVEIRINAKGRPNFLRLEDSFGNGDDWALACLYKALLEKSFAPPGRERTFHITIRYGEGILGEQSFIAASELHFVRTMIIQRFQIRTKEDLLFEDSDVKRVHANEHGDQKFIQFEAADLVKHVFFHEGEKEAERATLKRDLEKAEVRRLKESFEQGLPKSMREGS